MQPWPDTRDTLLARLHNPEDKLAWRQFVGIYEPLIFRVATRRGLQDADARDVTQTVLLTVAKASEDWQQGNDRGSFRGWLAKTTTNAAINLLQRGAKYRGSGATTMLQLLNQAQAPSDDLTNLWQQQRRLQLFRYAASQVRDRFEEGSWQCFWMVSIDGQSCQTVARQLKKSLGAVYAARSRVMAEIRKTVEQLELQESG